MPEKTLDQIMDEIRPKLPPIGQTEQQVKKLVGEGYYTPEEGHARIKQMRRQSIKPHLRGVSTFEK